jgi:ABC-type lipoprotein release transport system permease subunit
MPYHGIDPAIVYLPTSRDGAHAGALLVRRTAANAAEQEHLSRLLERVDVNRAAFEVVTLVEIREVLLYPLRVASWIGSLLGIAALTLSVSGLYGLLTYVLGQRTREIGIRMVLGASARGVVQLIMRQSARVVGIGMAVGLVFTYSALTLLDATLPLRAGNVSIFDG